MNLRDLLARLLEYDTALLANTIERIDPTPAEDLYMSGMIRCFTPEFVPITGMAFTAELDSSTPGQTSDTDPYWKQMEEMQSSEAPVLWVVKAAGSRPEHECVLGDGMAKTLHACGCIGVITDGGVRDVSGMRAIPFAVYAKGATIHHTALRFMSTGKPVQIGGLIVKPGDILHANSEGVIRIPRTCLEVLSQRARAMQSFEHEAHEMLRQRSIPIGDKRRLVSELLDRYGFGARTAPDN